MDFPPNDRYCSFERNDCQGFALRSEQSLLIPALLDRETCGPVDGMGRGALYRFPLSAGNGILREYRRGGMMQRLLTEGSLTNRPLREWRVISYLHEKGFPVPEPLGVVWRRAGGLVFGAIATRELDASTLCAWLSARSERSEDMLEAVGKLVRVMHDLGVYHADLHVGNVLVSSGSDASGIYIVDFDKARIGPLTDIQRAQNLLRLRRSFVKRGLRLTDYERIRRAYGAASVPQWLEWLYDAKSALSDSVRSRTGTNAV